MIDTNDVEMIEQLKVLEGGVVSALLITLLAWRWGFYQISRKLSAEEDLDFPLKIVIQAFFIFFTVQLVAIPIIAILWLFFMKGIPLSEIQTLPNLPDQGWLNVFAIIMTGACLFGYLCTLSKPMHRHIWGSGTFAGVKEWGSALLTGVIAWFVSFPIVVVLTESLQMFINWVYPREHLEQVAVKHLKSTLEDTLLFWITAILIVCIVPLIEEILFRGILQNYLKKHVGSAKAIAISALLFAMFHFSFSQGLDNVPLLASLSLLGAYLGFVYEKKQSLWASISLHAFFNAISIFMLARL